MADEKKSNVLNDTLSKMKDAMNSDAVKSAAGTIKGAVTCDKVKNAVTNIASSIKSKKTDEEPAIVKCPACQHDVSNTALKCPNCGHQLRKPQRTKFGKICLWIFYGFNILMLFWIIAGVSGTNPKNEWEAAGAGIGVMALILFWVLGDIITGLLALMTRPKG